jgi:hypothetical protein
MESNRAVSGFNTSRYVAVRDMTMRLFRLPGELDKIGSGAPVPPGFVLHYSECVSCGHFHELSVFHQCIYVCFNVHIW